MVYGMKGRYLAFPLGAFDTEVSGGTNAILEIAGIVVPILSTVLRNTDEGTHLTFESVEASA